MSFSSEVKTELTENMDRALHCRIACVAGMMTGRGRRGEDGSVSFRSEKEGITDCFRRHISVLMGREAADSLISQLDERGRHVLRIRREDLKEAILLKCKLRPDGVFFCPDRIITEKTCCKKAFLRGLFLSAGAVGSPEKAYQLEIRLRTAGQAVFAASVLQDLDMNLKILDRGGDQVLYLKDGNQISDFLGALGASRAMMEFENVRIMKDIRNDINREVNCDTANSRKTAAASVKQRQDILLVMGSHVWKGLPEHLKEAAEARLGNPDLSLAELGQVLSSPVGKSGIRHRLNKISDIAESIRKKEIGS